MRFFKESDCEDCPLSWEDRSYEGDCDCGCYIYEDLYGDKFICRLPMFIKRFIATRKIKKIEKEQARQYDGIGEWYKEEQRKETAMQYAINETLKERGMFLCFRSEEQDKYYPIRSDSHYGSGYFDASYGEVGEIVTRYEEKLR